MKNIVVTGAGGGMGKAVCKRLQENGYRVFALDFNTLSLENVCYVHTDVTNEESIKNAFAEVSSHVDKIDAIIHFAGIYKLDSLVEMSEKEFVNVFNVNVFGIYRINRIFLPLLHEKAKIIITSSELAPLDPLPFTGIYAVTKKAVESYAYSLRMELQLSGIQVSLIRPGAIDTGMLSVSTSALDAFCERTKLYRYNAKRFRQIVDSVESKKVPPEKIAAVALKILEAKRPKYVYNVNRNPLLRLLNALPQHFQTKIIKNILAEH